MPSTLLLRASAAACLFCVAAALPTVAEAGYPHRGWYGHDIVPFVPDASGFVVVAPTHPGPFHVRIPEHQHGMYDFHGRWSVHRMESPAYPWGWFGAKRRTWSAVQPGYRGERTDWSVRPAH